MDRLRPRPGVRGPEIVAHPVNASVFVLQAAAMLGQPIRSTSSRNFASECRPANEGDS
jgi:hypothetical protein